MTLTGSARPRRAARGRSGPARRWPPAASPGRAPAPAAAPAPPGPASCCIRARRRPAQRPRGDDGDRDAARGGHQRVATAVAGVVAAQPGQHRPEPGRRPGPPAPPSAARRRPASRSSTSAATLAGSSCWLVTAAPAGPRPRTTAAAAGTGARRRQASGTVSSSPMIDDAPAERGVAGGQHDGDDGEAGRPARRRPRTGAAQPAGDRSSAPVHAATLGTGAPPSSSRGVSRNPTQGGRARGRRRPTACHNAKERGRHGPPKGGQRAAGRRARDRGHLDARGRRARRGVGRAAARADRAAPARPASLVQLAEGVGVTASTTSRLVDRLVAGGFAERRPSPESRRRSSSLTPTARRPSTATTSCGWPVSGVLERIPEGRRAAVAEALSEFATAARMLPETADADDERPDRGGQPRRRTTSAATRPAG